VFDALATAGIDLADVCSWCWRTRASTFEKSWAELLESVRVQLESAELGVTPDAIACTNPTAC